MAARSQAAVDVTALAAAEASGEAAPTPAGRVHAVDPRIRVALAFAFALATVSLDGLGARIAAFALAAGVAALARMPLAPTVRRLLGIDALLAPLLLFLPFTVEGRALGTVWGLPFTAEGLGEAAAVLLAASATALSTLALVGSIEPARLGEALRRLGAPAPVTRTLLLTVRYIPTLHQEFARGRIAMRARGFTGGGGPHAWTSYGHLIGMTLVRSLERGERVAAAMKARGYAGRFPCEDPAPIGLADWAFGAAGVAALAALGAIGTGLAWP